MLLIDSNAISEIVYNGNIVSSDFFTYALRNKTVVCFSFYNVLEIKNGYSERWEKFLDIFSKFPCAIIKPSWQIILDEVQVCKGELIEIYPLFNHFSMLGKDSSYDFKIWINEVLELSEGSLEYEQNIFRETMNYFNIRRDSPEYRVKIEFAKRMKIEKLDPLLKKMIIVQDLFGNPSFPSIEIIFKTFYHRYTCLERQLIISDMNDIAISSCVPYIYAFVTEKYQTHVINEILGKMQLQSIKCFKVSSFFKGRNFPALI